MKIKRSEHMFQIVGVFFLPVLLFLACTSSKKSEEGELASLSEEEKKQISEYQAEVEVGRNMAGRLLTYYGSHGDNDLISYVNQVTKYVAGYGDYPDRRYMVGILDTEMVNAFACPGGYIFVTLGTLKEARTEAELAAILAHEVAHVGKQHMYNALKTMENKKREELAKETESKKSASDVDEIQVRARVKSETNSEVANMIARYAGSSAGAGFGLLQAAKAGMSLILEKGLDKKYEFEADHEGVKYAIRAGYKPGALLDFLTRLGKKRDSKEMTTLGKTHPKVSTRKRRIVKLLREMKAKDIIGATGKKRYESYREKLPAKDS